MKKSVIQTAMTTTLTIATLGLSAFVANTAEATEVNPSGRVKRHYVAELRPLNSRVAGETMGKAYFKIDKGVFKAKVYVKGSPANTLHVQHIHTADSCPDMSADTNQDGYVDVIEGVPSYGLILVPLDGDLNSQSAGGDVYPTADAKGTYKYTEMADLDRMLADLRAADPNPDDAVVKLPANENLNLAGRQVVIHGVPLTTELPETVKTLGDIPRQITLPIACGEIREID